MEPRNEPRREADALFLAEGSIGASSSQARRLTGVVERGTSTIRSPRNLGDPHISSEGTRNGTATPTSPSVDAPPALGSRARRSRGTAKRRKTERRGMDVGKSELLTVPMRTGNAVHADPEEGYGSQE